MSALPSSHTQGPPPGEEPQGAVPYHSTNAPAHGDVTVLAISMLFLRVRLTVVQSFSSRQKRAREDAKRAPRRGPL